jgi:hypothetical protein
MTTPAALMQFGEARLDAGESVWFKRQLEFIDKTMYETIWPENKARSLIPTQGGVPDWAKVYTWRMYDRFGRAKIAANMADDIPRADRTGQEQPQIIKPVTAAYGWDIFEIKASAALGTQLDAMKAIAARYAIEQEIDSILALGNAEHNLQGLLTQATFTNVTPATKTGGGTAWNLTPAEPDEIAGDVFNVFNTLISGMKGAGGPVFQKFTVLLPIKQYGIIAQRRMSAFSDVTILNYILKQSPFVESIEPWYRLSGIGAGSTDRMCVYPKNPMVVSGIVPMEFTTQPPDQRNLEFVINCLSTTGGTVIRYPVALAYMDGI